MFSSNAAQKRIALVVLASSVAILALSFACTSVKTNRSDGSYNPDVSTHAGALQGTFRVSSSGAASYSIPVSVPPGTHNIAPRLSVNYTHSSGNGLLGMGFSVSGLPTIERVAATVAQDGFTGSINYDEKDRFSSNGTRLINTKGVYGAHETVYHTETESWKKVTSYGTDCGSGPCWFKVTTKKGYTLEFGNTEDSGIGSTNGKGIRVWALNKITDLNGNYIVFTYHKDSINGSYYPTQINYTGNDNTGLLPQRSVKFSYENRKDTVTTYQGGGRITNTRRLDSISTYVGETNVLNYRFHYEYGMATGRSRLVRVEECDKNGKCLPPTSFSWQDGKAILFKSPQVSSQQIKAGELMPLDINGDGLTDFANINKVGTEINPTQLNAYISEGNSFSTADSVNFTNDTGGRFFATDLNGDGLGDMMKVYLNEQLTVNTFLSDGTGFDASPLVYNGPSSVSYGNFGSAFLSPADVNGDGRTDLVHARIFSYNDSSKVQLTNFLSTGNGFEAQTTQYIHWTDQTGAVLSAMDVNGDGMSDLVYVSKDNYANPFQITPLFSEQGTSYRKGNTQSFPLFKGAGGQLLGSDVNGDGMSDLVYAYLQDSLYLSTYFSTGKEFVQITQSHQYPGKGWLMAMEINGDNLTDLTYVNSSYTDGFQFISYLSEGHAFQSGQTITNKSIAAGQNPMPLDMNGDAKTDFLLSRTISGNIPQLNFTSLMNAGLYPDLIDSMDNAIGGLITVRYKPLTDKSVYRMADNNPTGPYPANSVLNKITGATYALGQTAGTITGATFPLVNVTLPTYAVARYTLQDGRGAVYPYSYFYRDAKVDRNGRGWLGFQSQVLTDSSAQNITNTHYLQPFPLSGKTDFITTYTLDQKLMTKSRTAYDVKIDSLKNTNKLYRVNQTQSRTENYDYGTFAYTLGKDYQYDAYGNVTLITDWGDTANNTPLYTINTYQNDTANWQLGYLTQTLDASDLSGTDTLSQQTITYDPVRKNMTGRNYWVAPGQSIDTGYVYDNYGNMIHSINQAGDTTTIVYDATYHTFSVQHITPPNQWGKKLISHFEYDPYFGKIKHYTDPNGNSLQIFSDGLGRAKEIQGPDVQGTMVPLAKLDYIPNPDVGYSTIKSIRLDWEKEIWKTTQSDYDGIIRNYKTSTMGQDNQVVIQQKEYNSNNKVTGRSFPHFKDSVAYRAQVHYDPYERIEKVVLPKSATDSIISQASYQGKSIAVTHAVGTADQAQMNLVYDYYGSQRKYTQQTNANGELTHVQYDLLGRIKQVTDPQNIKSLLWYDGVDRRTRAEDASLGTVQFLYNDNQRIYQMVNAKNDTITHTMDALNRVILEKRSEEQPIRYEYDLENYANTQGKLAKVLMNPDLYYTYTYDRYGNFDSTLLHIDGKSYAQVQKYNPNRSLAGLVFPDSSEQMYQYTPQGLLKAIGFTDVRNPGAGTQTCINYQQYDAGGGILDVLYGNQVSGSYGYTPLGKIQSSHLKNARNEELTQKNYTWDDAMQITTIEDLLDNTYTQNFTYDPSGRLLTADGIYGAKTYQYDASGNMLLKDQVNYTYNNYRIIHGVQQQSPTDTVFKAQYDETGNRIGKTVQEEGKPVRYTYKYDVLNRLKSVEKEGSLLYTFRYDYTGRRLQKIDFTNGIVSTYVSPNYEITTYADSTVYTRNILGAGRLISTVSYSDSDTENAAPAAGGMPVTGVLYFHQDHIDNTKLTTSAEGTPQSKLVYQPYGQIYEQASGGPDNFRYKFGGKELDQGSGLYYFNARYYDPQTGRFISADTRLGGHPWQTDVLNRYAYVLNNPIKNSDPSGHGIVKDIVTGVTIAVTVAAEVAVAVGTAGLATPVEVVGDVAAVGAEAGVEEGTEMTTYSITETGESMGKNEVESATENLTDCDCGKMDNNGESMCFVAGTLIATERGNKPIEEIKKGDKVWAWNEETQSKELRAVTGISKRQTDRLVNIRVDGAEITTTPEHPFMANGQWRPAFMLKAGDILFTSGKNTRVVQATKRLEKATTVYNLQVDKLHNYWVSSKRVLVHNACGTQEVENPIDQLWQVNTPLTPIDLEGVAEGAGQENNEFARLEYNNAGGVGRINVRIENGFMTLKNEYSRESVIRALRENVDLVAYRYGVTEDNITYPTFQTIQRDLDNNRHVVTTIVPD